LPPCTQLMVWGFTTVTMKSTVFWDIKTQFVPHRRDVTSPLQSPAGLSYARFEIFTAVTMKNAVFWDIKSQFVPHGRHIISPLQILAGKCYVRFEIFTAVTMKNAVFWDVIPYGCCRSQRFGGSCRFYHQGRKNQRTRNNVSSK
jgi:hypothetical protein